MSSSLFILQSQISLSLSLSLSLSITLLAGLLSLAMCLDGDSSLEYLIKHLQVSALSHTNAVHAL